VIVEYQLGDVHAGLLWVCDQSTGIEAASGVRFSVRLAPSTSAREDRSGLTWRSAMALRIICMCGYVIQSDDDDELWRNAQDHMAVLHPELVGNVTRADILAQAERL
jgi:hypothetical protein